MTIISVSQPELIRGEKRFTTFSDCRTYRYLLEIEWDASKPFCQFIGLNPSTADEVQDDPTIRRIKSFAKDWGYGGLLMTNLFAFRATDPEVMKAHANPIGEVMESGQRNDIQIVCAMRRSGLVVAAWGKDGAHMNRDFEVMCMSNRLMCLKINADGTPSHPLYLAKSLKLIPYAPTGKRTFTIKSGKSLTASISE